MPLYLVLSFESFLAVLVWLGEHTQFHVIRSQKKIAEEWNKCTHTLFYITKGHITLVWRKLKRTILENVPIIIGAEHA